MSKKWRKVVSLLMAVFMIQSLISVSAFATETETQSDDSGISGPYYKVSVDNNNIGTYQLNKNEKGEYDLKEALNKVGAKGAATGSAEIDVYDATIKDLCYTGGSYAMQNLKVTLHNCTVDTWGFQIGCAGNVTWEFDKCVFLQNLMVMYDGGTKAPIDFIFSNCDFRGTFDSQGCTIGDLTMENCKGLKTANATNGYDPINAPLLNPYIHKNSKGNDAKLSVVNCTYVDERNQANALLAYGNNFANYEFENNKWADGSQIYIQSYKYNNWYYNVNGRT